MCQFMPVLEFKSECEKTKFFKSYLIIVADRYGTVPI